MDNVVEIALLSAWNYFRGMAVACCSIAKRADANAFLRFHVLQSGFTEEGMRWMEERIGFFHRRSEVVFHDVSEVERLDLPAYSASKMTYARLLLPKILPEVDVVVYSDVDTLWLADACELWKLRGKVGLVGCSHEQSAGTLAKERAWFEAHGLPFDESRYFCAGVAVYNLREIRRRDAFAPVLEFGRKYKGYNCADQSMMYGALGNEVTLLPDKWQVFPRNGVKIKRGEPVVLHYAGEAPWKASRVTRMLTDTQLLWFDMCAEVFGETKWRSLRKFYKAWEIVAYRAVFLAIFRIPPLHALFRVWLRRTGRGPFEESLR